MFESMKSCGGKKEENVYIFWEGGACSFKSDNQEMIVHSLNIDLKGMREIALHIFGERPSQTDKTGSTKALRYKNDPVSEVFLKSQ